MPNVRICKSSGALIFSPTKQEKEVIDLKKELRSEIDEVRELKEELKSLLNKK